jgi:hypothetical protein
MPGIGLVVAKKLLNLRLKQKLVEALLLRTHDERLPYEIVTDASDLGLDAVLLQEGHPVAFKSRKLNSAEQ